MPDTQTPQGDKGRKTRPFGSFLLFLTVLVVILIAFGGEHLGRTESLSQDQFEWALYTGQVEHLTVRGEPPCGKRDRERRQHDHDAGNQ